MWITGIHLLHVEETFLYVFRNVLSTVLCFLSPCLSTDQYKIKLNWIRTDYFSFMHHTSPRIVHCSSSHLDITVKMTVAENWAIFSNYDAVEETLLSSTFHLIGNSPTSMSSMYIHCLKLLDRADRRHFLQEWDPQRRKIRFLEFAATAYSSLKLNWVVTFPQQNLFLNSLCFLTGSIHLT